MNKETVLNRIKKIIDDSNLTNSEFAEKIGVPKSSISHLLSERNKPSLDLITKISENFEEITSTIDLADTFYKNSSYSIKDIPISFRFSILVARRIYRKIGYNILNKKTFENYKNSGKIYVSDIEKSIETIFAIFDLIRLSLTSIKEDQIQHDHFLINEEINLDERI